ncbi:MAG TPA: hypothetical protein VFE62_19315 [Gemmataceae bacterium]|nr:hypothetical protein [Gemmataceae bacterium]
MSRWLSLAIVAVIPTLVRADAFDNYINPILAKAPQSKNVQKINKLSAATMVENSRALPGISAAFVIVKTNNDRWAKLLVMPGQQKVPMAEPAPIVIVERYVTFREGEERVVHASGQQLHLFENFRLNLDIGQVVPKDLGADLRVGSDKDGVFLEPVGKAEMYLVTKHLPEANPEKPKKLVVGAKFETRYFNGSYKLHDDGRRSGKLELTVDAKGEVTGFYYSDKDGSKYEVDGKVSNSPQHRIDFRIHYPRTIQDFSGFLFTGNGAAITGSSTLENTTTGFYATRIE